MGHRGRSERLMGVVGMVMAVMHGGRIGRRSPALRMHVLLFMCRIH